MKKRIISVTIFVISLFTFSTARASMTYDAKTVNEKFQKYTSAAAEIVNLKCDSTLTSSVTVDKCNNLALEKTRALAYLYNAKAYDSSLITSDIKKVLDDNSSKCNTTVSNELQAGLTKIFMLFYIAGPILLLLFGSLDLTQSIVAGDEKRRKALMTNFVKRCIALGLLLASPAIVSLIISLFGPKQKLQSTFTCDYSGKKVTISYTPTIVTRKKNNLKGNGEMATKIVDAAAKIIKVSSSNKWSYDCVGMNTVISNTDNNKSGTMCCADFVSAALYYAEAFTKEELNNMQEFNRLNCNDHRGNAAATGVQSFLNKKGWIRIDSIDELQAGDIVFISPQPDNGTCNPTRAGHVEIYIGDNLKYNAGNTDDMRSKNPVSASYKTTGESRFICAYRAP